MARETPPLFMEKSILNFHFDYWNPFLRLKLELLSGGELVNLRSLDCQGVCHPHEGGNKRLPSVQIRLSAHNLHNHDELLRVQVPSRMKISKKYQNRIFLRVCDSRNLNLSPFCNLSSQSLPKWQPEINSTYGNSSTSYTSALPGPMRPRYPGHGKASAEKELFVSLTQVFQRTLSHHDGSL